MSGENVLNKFITPEAGDDNEFVMGGTVNQGGTGTLDLDGTWKIDGVTVTASAEQLNSVSSTLTVANKSGGDYAAGDLVYINGFDTTLNAPTVALADADDQISVATHVLTEAIVDDASGTADGEVLITGLNTDSYSAVGSLAYLSATAGETTETAPTAADDVVQVVGVVKVKSATVGIIQYFPGYRAIASNRYLTGVTAGTAVAGQALVLDASKDATAINTLGIADIADFVKMLGLNDIIGGPVDGPSVGTWTVTRIARGDYVTQKTATDEASVIPIDITEILRTTASKGLKITSFDVIFRNITTALDAHSVTLDKIAYTDSETVATTSIALTGALATGTDADPQVSNVVIDTPAFNITDDSKYVMEITLDAAAGSVYDFIGVMLKFTTNPL